MLPRRLDHPQRREDSLLLRHYIPPDRLWSRSTRLGYQDGRPSGHFPKGLRRWWFNPVPHMRIWDLHTHFPASGGATAEKRAEALLRVADRMGIERLCL